MNPIDRFWVSCFFNCSEAEYFGEKNSVHQHSFFEGYNGFFVLHFNNRFIISAPYEYVESLKKVANGIL